MEKVMKLGDIIGLGSFLANTEDILGGAKLNAKALYNILKLKKILIDKFGSGQEALMALAKNYDAKPIDDGKGMQVPPEKLDDFNKEYRELMSETETIHYDPIEISANAEMDAKFMEAFFDFIMITD